MLSTMKKLGSILVSACPSACVSICPYVKAMVLKLHILIPHEKIAGMFLIFFSNHLSLLKYAPLKINRMTFCRCDTLRSVLSKRLEIWSADRE